MRTLLIFCLAALWPLSSWADYGGSRGTYLKFELEKVSIVSIEFHGIGAPIRSKVLRISGLPAQIETSKQSGRGPLSVVLTGKRQHRPIRVTKPVDKATPLIQKALVNNQILPRVVLYGRHRETGRAVILVLVSPRITAQQQQSRSSTGTVQTEMVALNLRGY